MSFDFYSERFLESFGPYIERGWVFCSIRPGLQPLIQTDRDCTLSSCPLAGTVHRHQPTLEDREYTCDILNDWLRLQYYEQQAAEAAARFEAQSRAELDRLFDLDDPRPSIASDADVIAAAEIAECKRICALNSPQRKRPAGVKHTLNLLRGLQPRNQRRLRDSKIRCVLIKRINVLGE
jgi:hypothetical protein